MNPPDVAVVLGTRPEAIKLAPVILALREAGSSCEGGAGASARSRPALRSIA